MRLSHIAAGCALTGGLGFLALPPATALAATTVALGAAYQAAPSATPLKTTLTLSGPTIVDYGASVVLAGRLSFAVGVPPAHTPVTIIRKGADTQPESFTVLTGADGRFSFIDRSPGMATYVYIADFAGDASVTSATATAQVTVEAVKPSISVSAPRDRYPYGATVKLTVTLGPTFTDRDVALYATPHGGKRTLIATGIVNNKHKWHVKYTLTRATTFTAVFPGDVHNAPASASRTLDVYTRG